MIHGGVPDIGALWCFPPATVCVTGMLAQSTLMAATQSCVVGVLKLEVLVGAGCDTYHCPLINHFQGLSIGVDRCKLALIVATFNTIQPLLSILIH